MYNLFSKNIFRMNNIVLFNDILKRLPKLILEVVGILFVVLVSLYFVYLNHLIQNLFLYYLTLQSLRLDQFQLLQVSQTQHHQSNIWSLQLILLKKR